MKVAGLRSEQATDAVVQFLGQEDLSVFSEKERQRPAGGTRHDLDDEANRNDYEKPTQGPIASGPWCVQ